MSQLFDPQDPFRDIHYDAPPSPGPFYDIQDDALPPFDPQDPFRDVQDAALPPFDPQDPFRDIHYDAPPPPFDPQDPFRDIKYDAPSPCDPQGPFYDVQDAAPPPFDPQDLTQHRDIGKDLDDVFNNTRATDFSPLKPSGIVVYLMTINIDPDVGIFGRNPNFMTKFLDNEETLLTSLNEVSPYKFVRQDYKKMKNSIILKTTRSSTQGTNVKVMKIFNNAKVQMNGLQSHGDVQLMIHLYQHLLKCVYNVNVSTRAPRVSMVNGRFNTNTTLDLRELYTVCQETNQNVVMNLELHPAMRMKAGSGTVFVFSSGRVLIMGSKEPSDMTLGFHNIMRIILQNHSRVYLDPVLIVGKKIAKRKRIDVS